MSEVQKKTVVDQCLNNLSTSRSVCYLQRQIIWKMTSSSVVINSNNNNNYYYSPSQCITQPDKQIPSTHYVCLRKLQPENHL